MSSEKSSKPEPGQIVTDLQTFMVPSHELECAEECFRVPVDFRQSPKNDLNIICVNQIVTALLNKYGGVIQLPSCDSQPVKPVTLDQWRISFIQQLDVFVPQSDSLIKIADHIHPVCLLVKPSTTHVTLKSHYHTRRCSAENKTLYNAVELGDAMTRSATKSPQFLTLDQPYSYGDILDRTEQKELEYKYWKDADIKTCIQRLKNVSKEKRTRTSLFSLPNVPGGGYVIFGVEEDKVKHEYVVRGQIVKCKEDQERLECFLRDFFNQDPITKASRIWGKEGCTAERSKHWDVSFHKIKNIPKNIKQNRYLIKIQLFECEGGMFEEYPESYKLKGNGEVHRLSCQDWQEIVIRETKTQTPEFVNCSSASKTYVSTRNDPTHAEQHVNSNEEIVNFINLNSCLSLTDHTYWNENNTVSSRDIAANLQTLKTKSDIFTRLSTMNFTPSEKTISKICPKEKLDEVKLFHGVNNTFAIASRRWLANITDDGNIKPPNHHIMDVLVVDEKPEITFWSIFKEEGSNAEERDQRSYLIKSGRIIKRKICQKMRERNVKGTVTIQCCLQKTVGKYYNLTQSFFMRPAPDIDDLTTCIGLMLLSKETHLKNKIGNDVQIDMTFEHMDHLLAIGLCQFNFVEGPPGSGKTYLGIRLAKTYLRESKEVSYLTTTNASKAVVQYHGIQDVDVITDTTLLDKVSSGLLNNTACVIIDDIHNIDLHKSTGLLFDVVRKHNVDLYIFTDNNIQNFKRCSDSVLEEMVRYCRKHDLPCKANTLTNVHRNSRKVISFMKSCFDPAEISSRIKCVHDNDGDDVEIRSMNNIRKDSSANELIHFVKSLMDPQSEIHYEARDIAVLVQDEFTESQLKSFRKMFQERLDLHVHGADIFPVQGLTVDFAEEFMGLETMVCIVIVPKCHLGDCLKSNTEGAVFGNKRYRAYLASRAIYRMVFVIEEALTSRLVKLLKFNKLPLMSQESNMDSECDVRGTKRGRSPKSETQQKKHRTI